MTALIDITMQLHAKTDKAVLVSDDGERSHAKWLPLSQIELDDANTQRGMVVVTLPEWLALEKGLI